MGNLRMNADQISYKGGEKPMSVEEAIKNAGNTGLAHTADIAPDFSTESAYSVGDYVYHNGTLYVFTSNHAAGAWSTDDTQVVTVGGELVDVKSGLTNVTDIVDITSTFYTSLETGVTLNSSTHVYKQGRRISGYVSITLDSNLPSIVKDILTLKYAPISSVITFGSCSDHDEYTANAIMYIYLFAGGKKLQAANNTTVANVKYLTVNLDYYAEA